MAGWGNHNGTLVFRALKKVGVSPCNARGKGFLADQPGKA